jgi:hypothetical protein
MRNLIIVSIFLFDRQMVCQYEILWLIILRQIYESANKQNYLIRPGQTIGQARTACYKIAWRSVVVYKQNANEFQTAFNKVTPSKKTGHIFHTFIN